MNIVKKIQAEIKLYNKEFAKWIARSNKIFDRYLDERKITTEDRSADNEARFNILWANTETIFPAVYARMPKPDVSRRYKDKDPTARVASIMLERCLEYEIEQYPDYDATLRLTLLDRLLPGRGTAWIRYEPTFTKEPVLSYDDEESEDDSNEPEEGLESITGEITNDVPEYTEKLKNECAPVDYVNWRDFFHSPARTWEEVKRVGRKVQMDKEGLEKRFGKQAEERKYKISDIPATEKPEGTKDVVTIDAENTKASVWEVWCKESRKVYWICEGCDFLLDERDDPLELQGFFPCPKPLYATISTSKLVPTPDYIQYQDQARELDEITNRIGRLQKAVKVVGVYDSSQTGIKRMLQEGVDNTLLPVETWAMFAEKGGIKGVIDFLPLKDVVDALNNLYVARESIKAVIYEITGIADILRGNSDPNETLGAQEIKANYAGLRIRKLQMDVARFARDLIRFKAEIITKFFSDETIVNMSGAMQMPEVDQQFIPQAIALLRNDVTRDFRVDIETDSMVEVDEQADKQAATELLTGTADYMEKAVIAAKEAPEVAPLMLEVLMFTLRRYKVGKTIEGQFQETFDKITEQLKNPQPKPDPEQMKVEAEAQAKQQQMQVEAQEMQARMQMENMHEQARMQADMMIAKAKGEQDMQLEQQKMMFEAKLEQERSSRETQAQMMQAQIDAALEQFKARLQAETQITVAEISADATLSAAQESAADKAVD